MNMRREKEGGEGEEERKDGVLEEEF